MTRWLLVLGLVAFANGVGALAQNGVPDQQPFRFRRVLIPEQELKKIGLGYRLMPSEEFERRARRLEVRSPSVASTMRRIENARYSARLVDDQWVSGKAHWSIVSADNQTDDLIINPLSLPVLDPIWESEPVGPALVGLNPENRLVVHTDRDGKLGFGWSLRGQRKARGTEFNFAVPPAASNQFELELPSHLQLRSDVGLLKQLPEAMPGQLVRRWLWEFAGATEAILRVEPTDALGQVDSSVFAVVDTLYDLRESGIDMRVEARLAVQDVPLQSLVVETPPNIAIVAVAVDEVQQAWQVMPSADATRQQVVIEFKEPLTGSNRLLQLRAIGPIRLDSDVPLPTFLLPDTMWQAGTAIVNVASHLALRHLALDRGWQSESLSADLGGSGVIRFQLAAPDAVLRVQLSVVEPRLHASIGTTLRVSRTSVSAQAIAEIVATQGRRFDFIAEVDEGWWIDSVETEPKEIFDDYELLPTDNPQVRQLRVQFREPIQSDRPVKLNVRAHRVRPPEGTSLGIDQLRLLSPLGVQESRRLLAVQAEPTIIPEITGDIAVHRFEISDLSESEQKLLAPAADALLFADDTAATRLRMLFRNGTPSYSAQVSMSAAIDAQSVRENYRLRIRPDASQISRLLVHASAVRAQPLNWSSETPSLRGLIGRRLSQGEQRNVGISEGEVWEITWSTPIGSEFELHGDRSLPITDRLGLALLSLPEAESQSGTVVVESSNRRVHLTTTDLHPIPAVTSELSPSRILGNFRYQPAHGGIAEITRADSWLSEHQEWIWEMRVNSRLQQSGEITHAARCRIESSGVGVLDARLPEGSLFRRLTVQGRVVMPDIKSVRTIGIPLPADKRFVTAEIEYVTPAIEGIWAGEIERMFPSFDRPVLVRDWRVLLSPEWELLDAANFTWFHRLFAMFGLPTLKRHQAAGTIAESGDMAELLAACTDHLNAEADAALAALAWRDFLQGLQTAAGDRWTIKVDFFALADRGISPASVLLEQDSPWTSENLQRALRRNGIGLRLVGSEIVVTVADEQTPANRWAEIDFWFDAQPARQSPWVMESDDWLLDSGYDSYLVPLAENHLDQRILVGRRDARATLGWATMLGSLGLLWWLGNRVSSWAIPGLTVATIATQYVSSIWLPVASAVLMGWFLAMAIAFWPRRFPAKLPTSMLVVTILSWAFAARNVGVASLHADDGTLSSEYRVLIPIDGARKPLGDHVYVPSDFDQLLRRYGDQELRGPSSLIRSARYQGTFQWDEFEHRLDFYELIVTFDFEVQNANESIRIPLGNQRVHLLPGKSTLDGESIDLEWDAEGTAVELSVRDSGHHQLQLRMRPAPRWLNDQYRVELAIPRLPRARLELSYPADAKGISVPSSLGAVEIGSESLNAELGPTDELVIQWQAETRSSAIDVDVDQLSRLKIGATGATLDFRLGINTAFPERLKSLTLKVDPRLRLLPQSPDQPLQAIRQLESDRTSLILDLKLTRPESKVDLAFEIVGTAGVGSVYFPNIRVLEARSARKLVGVIVEPPLLIGASIGTPVQEASRVFLTAWGDDAIQVQSAYRLPASPIVWRLDTRLPMPEVSVDEKLDLAVSFNAVRVHWTGAFRASSDGIFQAVVRCPPQLHIAQVTFTDTASSDRATTGTIPWSRDEDGTLYVRPNRAMSNAFLLEIRGEFQPPANSEWDVPHFRTENSKIESQWLNIYRQPDANFEVLKVAGFEPQLDIPLGEYRSGWGRLAFQAETKDENVASRQIRLRVLANHPYSVGRSITTMDRKQGEWFARLDYRLQVRDGVVDAFRLEIPQEWSGPFELKPALAYEVVAIPGQTRKQLVIRPPTAISGEYQLQIISPISSADNDPDSVPEIMPLDVEKVERFVIVPTMMEAITAQRQQRLSWEIRGLQAASLPDDVPTDLRNRLPIASYQVVGPQFQAVIQDVQREVGESSCPLVWLRAHVRENDTALISASCVIDPAGVNRCQFELPLQATLVFATVDGRTSKIGSVGVNQWEIDFASGQLPQHLQILYEFRAPQLRKDIGEWEIVAPVLNNIDVRQYVWSISGAEPPLAIPDERGAATRLRYQVFSDTLSQADDVAADHSALELNEWLTPWRRRFDAMAWEAALRGSAESNAATDVDEVKEAIRRYSERQTLAEPSPESGGSTSVPTEFGEILTTIVGPAEFERAETRANTFLVRSHLQRSGSGWTGHLIAALALLGGTAALLGRVRLFVSATPEVSLVLVGLLGGLVWAADLPYGFMGLWMSAFVLLVALLGHLRVQLRQIRNS